ncbi:MAG: hypothetical protein H7144_00650 [Burkholderiales bacterium]|nr:hypothetical protein [Phycisphaerae bacterium]
MADESTTQSSAAFFSARSADQALDALRQGMAQTDLLEACHDMNVAAAVVLIFAGVIFLLWGFYAFKTLVTLNAAIIGAWLGAMIGEHAGAPLPAAIIGAIVAATVTWPLMKYAVAIMGGLIGMIIGMSLWRAFGLEPRFATAGGGMGLIFCGMLSFILFRTSVMMFTSLQGSIMLIFGILGVIYKFQGIDTGMLDHKLSVSPFVMPMAVFIASIGGIIYQNAQGSGEAAAKK